MVKTFNIYTLTSFARYCKRDKYLMHNFISGKVIISKSMSNCALHAKPPPGLRENNDVIWRNGAVYLRDHPYITSAKGLGRWGQKNGKFWWSSVLFMLTIYSRNSKDPTLRLQPAEKVWSQTWKNRVDATLYFLMFQTLKQYQVELIKLGKYSKPERTKQMEQ